MIKNGTTTTTTTNERHDMNDTTKKTRDELKAKIENLANTVPDLSSTDPEWYNELFNLSMDLYKYDVNRETLSQELCNVWNSSRCANKNMVSMTLNLIAEVL